VDLGCPALHPHAVCQRTGHQREVGTVQHRGERGVSGTLPPGLRDVQVRPAEAIRQAAMMAFLDNFKMLGIVFFAVIPILLMMRKPRVPAGGVPVH
jgi:hypothetical protein